MLARLLAPEDFGVVALALFYVTLAAQIRSVGLDHALISHQNADETVQRTYFTLYVGLLLLSTLLLLGAAPVLGRLYPGMALFSSILVVMAGTEVVKGFSTLQETWLTKNLAFRQLALTDVVASIVMTLIAPTLAWLGWGVWALVAEQGSGVLARLGMTWLVFRIWMPRPGWDATAARWFWNYGKSAWRASNLNFLLDRFDDFWIGTVLGQAVLGYYSRAYEFARYPRRVFALPLVSVFHPIFARLQDDRQRLSQAFYRAAYVIFRVGGLISGVFALLMPEFIHLVIGNQWAPMLLTFRLMLVYTLLDSLLLLSGNLLFAVGRPHLGWNTMRIQALFFIPAVILGAAVWGINGVALATNLMLVIGWLVVYRYLRQLVDFSPFRLFFWPTLALVGAYAVGLVIEATWQSASLVLLVSGKVIGFSMLYLGMLMIAERADMFRSLRWAWNIVRRKEHTV